MFLLIYRCELNDIKPQTLSKEILSFSIICCGGGVLKKEYKCLYNYFNSDMFMKIKKIIVK